jgi:hypothetical protein
MSCHVKRNVSIHKAELKNTKMDPAIYWGAMDLQSSSDQIAAQVSLCDRQSRAAMEKLTEATNLYLLILEHQKGLTTPNSGASGGSTTNHQEMVASLTEVEQLISIYEEQVTAAAAKRVRCVEILNGQTNELLSQARAAHSESDGEESDESD